MKLKNYLSAKRLRRKLSKPNVNESHCNVNDSFTDFNDNEVKAESITRDDMFLRPKREGGIGVRSDMTQSFSGSLPSYQSQLTQTDLSPKPKTSEFGSQTSVRLTTPESCQTYSPISTDPNLFFYKDCIHNIDMSSIDTEDELVPCQCYAEVRCQCRSCDTCSWHYHSLPSSQPSHQYMQDVHYNSLPAALTQSAPVDSNHSLANPTSCDRWKRSRIKTNPWLPLPKPSNPVTLRRRECSNTAEPRLSRFFSEVEKLMREQLGPDADNLVDIHSYICGSAESLASTCSTATEMPEKQSDDEGDNRSLVSQSESGSDDTNLADTESLSAEPASTSSSSSNLSQQSSDLESSCSVGGHHPPSLQDFNAAISAEINWTSSSSSLLSESMFASSYSPKYEALEHKVRKLCQSTSDLNEKMRLARLECSYIKTQS